MYRSQEEVGHALRCANHAIYTVRNVEHGTFTPLIFSATGTGLGCAATVTSGCHK